MALGELSSAKVERRSLFTRQWSMCDGEGVEMVGVSVQRREPITVRG